MAAFELATATRIVFGRGSLAQAPAAAASQGMTRVLVVSGKRRERAAALEDALRARGVHVCSPSPPLTVPGEPTVELARHGAAVALSEGCDGIIAIGGGSALDAGKAIAALAANGDDPFDYLEVVGRGLALTEPSLPFIAIPTTAGTGSEVTRNAVLVSARDRVKASLRSPFMLPRVAIVDPDLLEGAPRELLASSGLDALTQLIEPFLSVRANPVTDALAREGMQRSIRGLRRVPFEEEPGEERSVNLALASLLGGICLANAGLGAIHGFAAAVGGMFDAPHGGVCAALLPAAMEVNLRALRDRAPHSPALDRFREVATIVTGLPTASADEGIRSLAALVRELGVGGLSLWGVTARDTDEIAAKAGIASSMKANPIELSRDELREIAVRSL